MKNKKMIKRLVKKIKKTFNQYINGTKGVISIFLAILMVPFASIAAMLINAARLNSAIAIFDEALCNASNSTLGTYDSFLRKRFGLLAMSQNTSSNGTGYTVQDLISETFEFYMEQNLGSLSNTYIDSESSAMGIYPLSDTSVLLSEVLEYSKYTVPTELLIDGLSLDDIVKNLTEKLDIVGNIFNTFSSGSEMVDKCNSCEEKLETLRTTIDGWVTSRDEYNDAYNNFKDAVNSYNDLIDEIQQVVGEKQTTVGNSENEVSDLESDLQAEAEKHPDLVNEWNELKKTNDETKIKEFKEEHKDELKDYFEIEEDLNTAKDDLSDAKTDLQNTVSDYNSQLSTKRDNVTTAKSNYISKIDAFASGTLSTGNAVVDAQTSVTSAINSGVSLTSNVVTNVYDFQKKGVDKDINEMKKNKAAATERGDNTAAYLWQDQIDEASDKKTEIGNENKLAKAASSATSTAVSTLDTFATENYKDTYSQLYSKLINLKTSVSGYVIKTDSVSKLDSASNYYVSVSTPLTSEQIKSMQENLASEIAGSTFFAVIKAIVGFIKAIFTLTTWYDPELNATINTGYYGDNIGGLPSTKDRSEGSSYSFSYEYQDEDSQKSEYYKQLLGEYSNNAQLSGSATVMETAMQAITDGIDTISDCCNNFHWYNALSNLGKIMEAIGNIISNIMTLVTNVIQVIAKAVGSKILLAGYITYNTSNRTTYTGKALTGQSYSLPNSTSSNQGYAFYGAETEYIINGSYSETDNQSSLFNTIYLIRLLYDIILVFTNSEVATIAGEAGAATFGIGTIVVYILYLIAEPFVDTLILVNNGDIPIVKTKVYLTPSGVTDLISAFFKLGLSNAQKDEAYKAIVKVAGAGMVDDDFAEDYSSAVSAFGTDKPGLLEKSMTFNYTKHLLLIMLLFKSSDTLLDRLADIIQMEGAYDAVNRIDKYSFDLDSSFTYLRSSGSFTTNEFIKISDGSGFKSTNRVVYRGY